MDPEVPRFLPTLEPSTPARINVYTYTVLPAGHTMRKYVVVHSSLSLSLSLSRSLWQLGSYIGGYCSAREEFNQLRGGVRVDLFMGAQVDVSDNYTSVERPPPERCKFPPQYSRSHRHAHRPDVFGGLLARAFSSSSLFPRSSPLSIATARSFLIPCTVECRWWQQRAGGNEHRVRKSLYVPRVNAFFSDGVNAKVPPVTGFAATGRGATGARPENFDTRLSRC
jgi:hypothetical protein